MATDKLVDFDHVTDYISREAAILEFCDDCIDKKWCKRNGGSCSKIDNINAVPAADVVPWEWLERYADYFCAGVSMPEFVREAKMFYEGTNEAMKGGVIDG